ncbi:MAG TPA: glycoside hydrolase family 43 protein [Candidatus Limnocylindrales bacterium]|jgi:beta-xylosidase|nr:glycoside hydrolase family 43 protein [Candidatus Limnocylindrales bacterium]
MRRWLAAPALVAVLLAGCGPADEDGPVGATSDAGATAAESPRPTPGEGEFVNPVLDTDFPDPHVIQVGDTWYAYATGYRYTTSTDLVSWERPRYLELRSRWATRDFWAPEVAETSAGYVLYYTGRSQLPTPGQDTAQCVGRAVAESPEGPFVDDLAEPLICQAEDGGTIDASPFVDEDGTRYLLYKNDGNCCRRPVKLWIQELSDDGLSLVGEPIDLGVAADNLWEGSVIEAPTLWLDDGTYYLFYSANAYYSATYAVGYATSDAVTGPFVEAEENPILSADFRELNADPSLVAAGPGHQTIIEDGEGELWIVYHAWDRTAIGYDLGGDRTMWMDRLSFEDGRVVVQGPTSDPQPAPAP